MQNTKKLLSITNLKKYFPVAKSSIFQRKRLYVRANEDITLDIFEGETLGIVGESGCGKSTLGRVLLQLYPQTAGCTLYYGTTIDEMTPSYVADTIRKAPAYRKKLANAKQKAEMLAKRVEEAGGEDSADFFLLQEANIARCEEQTHLSNIAKVLGGFYVKDDHEGLNLMMEIFRENEKKKGLRERETNHRVEYEHFDHTISEAKESKKAGLTAKRTKAEQAMKATQAEIKKLDEKIAGIQKKLDEVKATYKDDPEFQKYEAMRDNGIDLARLKYKEMRGLRKDMQIIFQDPYSSLNPRFTVGQIIEEGLVTHKFFKHGSSKLREYIVDTMEKCGLQEYMLHRYPHQFSGGQRKRICLARELVVAPQFVAFQA